MNFTYAVKMSNDYNLAYHIKMRRGFKYFYIVIYICCKIAQQLSSLYKWKILLTFHVCS